MNGQSPHLAARARGPRLAAGRAAAAALIVLLLALAAPPGRAEPAQDRVLPPVARRPAAPAVTTTTIVPASPTLQGCGTITVAVWVNDVIGLYGADVRMAFDPALLEVQDFDPGVPGIQLENGGFLVPPLFTVRNTADNTLGTLQYAITQLNPTPPANGSGPLFVIRFRARATGVAALTFTGVDLSDRNGLPLPSTPVNNSLATAPAAPLAVTISRLNATTARLSWTASTGAASYLLYRGTTPYFTPGTVYQTLTTLSYDDVGALGDPVTDYFYVARAACANGYVGSDSNRTGAIDYARNVAAGTYSLIAVPFGNTGITRAAGLATYLTGVDGLLKWNPATQSFRFFAPPNIGDNFSIVQGDAVFVHTAGGGPAVASFVGDVTPVSFSLVRGGGYNYISLPLQRANLLRASNVAADITNVTSLMRWNEVNQSYRFFAPPNIGDNFTVKPGLPFVVALTASGPSTWP